MHRLVAIDLPPSVEFVDHVTRIWNEGDAILPLDQRLAPALRLDLARTCGASKIIHQSSTTDLGTGVAMGDDEALVIATSGSTGEPKGVVHTHQSLRASAHASATALGLTGSEHWLVCIPVSHIGGFSVIVRARHTGADLTAHETFDPHRVENAGCSHVSLVPTALRRIDASIFSRILLGGQAAPPNLPANVTVTYGSTETGGGITYDGMALPGVSLRVVDGEIQVQSPTLFARYLRNPTSPLIDGWYRTGDAGQIVDGKLSVIGRLGEMIISGGENIWPQRIEHVLRSLPGVEDVAAIGVADDEWGNVVEVFLETSRNVSRDEVREVIVSHLPTFYVPKVVRCIASFPRTSSGKVDKVALATLAR